MAKNVNWAIFASRRRYITVGPRKERVILWPGYKYFYKIAFVFNMAILNLLVIVKTHPGVKYHKSTDESTEFLYRNRDSFLFILVYDKIYHGPKLCHSKRRRLLYWCSILCRNPKQYSIIIIESYNCSKTCNKRTENLPLIWRDILIYLWVIILN